MAMEAGDNTVDTEEMKTPRRKRLAERWADGGFFAAWQRDRLPTTERAHDLEDDEDEDDDDSPESSAAKPFARGKRAGSLLLGIKSLFRREPAKVEVPAEETVDIEVAPDALSELVEPDEPEAIEATDAGPAAEVADEIVEDEDDDEDEDPVAATSGSSGGSRGSGGGRRPPGSTPSIPPGRGSSAIPPFPAIGLGSPGVGPAPAPDRAPTVVRERVIVDPGRERLAALALLATGAEYIGRRRADRRQERQFDRKLETAKKDNRAETVALQDQAEQLARRQREEARQAKERELVFERKLRDQPKPTERTVSVPEKNIEKQPVYAAEIRPNQDRRVESTTVYERRPEVPAVEKVELRTETLANQPKEMLYEQRHEIKDDQAFYTNTNQQDDLAKLQALQQANARQLAGLRGMQYQQPADQKQVDKQAQAADPALYKQAMLMGLVGAGLVVVLGLIAYAVLR